MNMNKNRLKFYFFRMALVAGVLFACSIGHAQSVPGVVTSAKTKSGSVTYVEMPRNGFDMDIFSKEAGEPYDFAGVVKRCADEKQQVIFAMNGAMCDKNLKPLGLLIKGLMKHKNFVWPDVNVFSPVEPSAVFAIDRSNVAHIIPGKSFKAADDLATYRLAIQSGTILISKGFLNRNITRAAGQQVCNGIGIKANGNIVFAITDNKMSLREFAIFFQDLHCGDAMLLDEGANCQWYAPGRPQQPGKLGEIVVVKKK
jgi:uncharacterized protein YigE (DUF2233 family)